MRRSPLLALVLLPLLLPAHGEETKGRLTLDRITADPPLAGREIRRGKWRDARRFTWLVPDELGPKGRVALHQFDSVTGRTAKLLDSPTVPAGTGGEPGDSKTLSLSGYEWNPAGTALVLNGENDLWLLEVSTGTVRRLTRDDGAEELAADPLAQIALCGDFNIAPTDDDIWDVEFFRGQTHVTPPERQAFAAIVDAGFTDVVRPHHPGPGVYTYWDYKQLSFPKRRGMRIDFALASPALAARVTGAWIDRDERKGKLPSDHAPVIVDIGD